MSAEVITLADKAKARWVKAYAPQTIYVVTPAPSLIAKGEKISAFPDAKTAYLVALDCLGTVNPVEFYP